jgi:rubrerythrin
MATAKSMTVKGLGELTLYSQKMITMLTESAPSLGSKKDCTRTCHICEYTWYDLYAKQKCPKCHVELADGFTFADTPNGQKQHAQMVWMQKRLKEDEKERWVAIADAKKRGEERAAAEWTEFRARLEDSTLGGGMSFDERIRRKNAVKQRELNALTHKNFGTLRAASSKGRARSMEEWRTNRAMLDLSDAVRRECLSCGKIWMDKFKNPDCPKCLRPMRDGCQPYKYIYEPKWWHSLPITDPNY